MVTIQPAEQVRPATGRPVSPEAAALGAAGLAAAAPAARQLVVRRCRPAPIPHELESDVRIENGFAEADPIQDLARRLAHSSDPAAAIASLLGQAYTAIFGEQLQPEERREGSTGVTVAATRHGRTSTTLMLAAPVAARPYLCNNMRAAAERAFGEQGDVDGLVGQDGDVLVRVTWTRADRSPATPAIPHEAALSLYRGDLLDGPNVPSYRWMYDEDPQIALTLRSDFRRRHKEARLRLAKLLAQGAEAALARAEELYFGLCAEDPEDERLWTALFRIHERTGRALGLKGAGHRLRAALVELGTDEVTDVDSVPLPSNLDRTVEVGVQLLGAAFTPGSGRGCFRRDL